MAMSKRRLPKPIRGRSNLVGGIPYFEVVVCRNGSMYLSNIFRVKGQPYLFRLCSSLYGGFKALFIKSTEFGIFGARDDEKSLNDMGIIKEGTRKDNSHRTFRFNAKDYEFCKRLVDQQDLSTYMKLFIR